jgi:hypothetical protein
LVSQASVHGKRPIAPNAGKLRLHALPRSSPPPLNLVVGSRTVSAWAAKAKGGKTKYRGLCDSIIDCVVLITGKQRAASEFRLLCFQFCEPSGYRGDDLRLTRARRTLNNNEVRRVHGDIDGASLIGRRFTTERLLGRGRERILPCHPPHWRTASLQNESKLRHACLCRLNLHDGSLPTLESPTITVKSCKQVALLGRQTVAIFVQWPKQHFTLCRVNAFDCAYNCTLALFFQSLA